MHIHTLPTQPGVPTWQDLAWGISGKADPMRLLAGLRKGTGTRWSQAALWA